ncbi:enoyl-CoA hydratase/isomerase family protein [Croceicoccus sp. F390]|uniref:Enoyl-CoA hydratase/isomerase family protein n=1 Tax=Croceicoccus esteveae TaxID=3075597 RepID=A0ABU2ZFW5_9SPHN|nr:enoyl-CoA hydratase/isomerase family protein [Croceicoccus sp. F390]MDT0575194.1 enoyl-CoA hydratase/isomerase family protein [Croceicoccus sp. F390]
MLQTVKPLAPADLCWLDPADCGPGSPHPYLLVDTDAGALDEQAVAALPCPVLGLGKFDPACDTHVERRDIVRVATAIHKAPLAAMVLVQLMRMTQSMSPQAALIAESMAFATLQQGLEFKRWLSDTGSRSAAGPPARAPLLIRQERSSLHLTLNRPDEHNKIDVAMRDALCEALDLAVLDRGICQVVLTGAGKMFSSGGSLREFGTTKDAAVAHWVRTLRLPAQRLLQLGPRLVVHMNGPAIGAGIEMAAFAHRVTASRKAWFQLPELSYGLLPGAGGTVSIARRIGRHRLVWLALSMARVRAAQAHSWGLLDALS